MKLEIEKAMAVLRELECDQDIVEIFKEDEECPECGHLLDAYWEEEIIYYILQTSLEENANNIKIRFDSDRDKGCVEVEGTITDYIVEQLGYISAAVEV